MRCFAFEARADAMTQEDHEIFDLVSALEAAEGTSSNALRGMTRKLER